MITTLINSSSIHSVKLQTDVEKKQKPVAFIKTDQTTKQNKAKHITFKTRNTKLSIVLNINLIPSGVSTIFLLVSLET